MFGRAFLRWSDWNLAKVSTSYQKLQHEKHPRGAANPRRNLNILTAINSFNKLGAWWDKLLQNEIAWGHQSHQSFKRAAANATNSCMVAMQNLNTEFLPDHHTQKLHNMSRTNTIHQDSQVTMPRHRIYQPTSSNPKYSRTSWFHMFSDGGPQHICPSLLLLPRKL